IYSQFKALHILYERILNITYNRLINQLYLSKYIKIRTGPVKYGRIVYKAIKYGGGLSVSWQNPENEKIRSILQSERTIAVVGLSDNPYRASYQIARAMQKSGNHIITVILYLSEVLVV